MKTAKQDSRFAWRVLCLFFVWGVWNILVGNAGDLGYIDEVTESLIQFIPFVLGFAVMLWYSRQSQVSTSIKLIFLMLSVSVSATLFLNITEDIPALNDVAFIGKDSRARLLLEYILRGAWIASGFSLVYLMVHDLQKTSRLLEKALGDLNEAQAQNIQRERLAALGEMASGIAHDLNNTLTPVVTYLELLLADSQLTLKQRQYSQCALQSATDAATVIKRLGDFYRGNASSLHDELVDLKSLVSKIPLITRPKWRDEAQLQQRDFDVQIELEAAPMIRGNASELRTVMTNLVFNAVDAMPQGGVIILRLTMQEDQAVIEVIDNGIGMSEEVCSHCFEPFYSTKVEKSGLGLSVCHGIVSRIGGTITIESRLQKGSVVRIAIPLIQTQVSATPGDHDMENTEFPLRCLCIEDDENVRNAFGLLLRAYGVSVDLVADGAAGLALIECADYDLVFTDLGMNVMDGSQILESIKSQHPQLPVVIVSGWPRDEVLAKFQGEFQPDDIIEKPATIQKILRILKAYSPAKSS